MARHQMCSSFTYFQKVFWFFFFFLFLYIERTDKLPVENQSIHVFVITQVEVDGKLLDKEASFCYLGDMLCAGGGCVLPITTRCSTACGKFRKLLPSMCHL